MLLEFAKDFIRSAQGMNVINAAPETDHPAVYFSKDIQLLNENFDFLEQIDWDRHAHHRRLSILTLYLFSEN